MKSSDFCTSTCRHCRFYQPQGRRGGHCSQLNVEVQGSWKTCSLATPVFEKTWDFQVIPVWKNPELIPFPSQADTALSDIETTVSSI